MRDASRILIDGQWVSARAAEACRITIPGAEKATLLHQVATKIRGRKRGLDAFREPKHVHVDYLMEARRR